MNPKVPMDIKIPRTLADARSQASEMVNPTQREAADRAITEAENTASLIGKQRAADLRARATSEGASAFERNGEIVSESRSMAADLRSGRVTTDDARKRLRQLSIAHKLTRVGGFAVCTSTGNARR